MTTPEEIEDLSNDRWRDQAVAVLVEIKEWFEDERIGTYDYTDSKEFYADIARLSTLINEFLHRPA